MPSPLAPWPHFCFYDLPKLLFGTPKRFQNLAAAPQSLLREASHADSGHLPWRLGRTAVFMTFRNCCLAPPNASKTSLQRLRPCFGRTLTPTQAISRGALTFRNCCLAPPNASETAVWHPQTLPKPRCSASEPA